MVVGCIWALWDCEEFGVRDVIRRYNIYSSRYGNAKCTSNLLPMLLYQVNNTKTTTWTGLDRNTYLEKRSK